MLFLSVILMLPLSIPAVKLKIKNYEIEKSIKEMTKKEKEKFGSNQNINVTKIFNLVLLIMPFESIFYSYYNYIIIGIIMYCII
jgi:hypothetical protein